LATILGRSQDGSPLSNPPLLESLAYDPVLAKCKLIAEAWDAGGLYQVGSFPCYGRWAEWNGKYRDTVRKFLKGDEGIVGDLSQRIQGSPDIYRSRGATAGINFITCHDGFTLYDMVAYNQKHNEANGENNLDGNNDNYSWNCGWEGETNDDYVNTLRHKQIKNALAILMVSQGVPMILMGDEMGRTKYGNNNTYCHDNELNWLNWELKEMNADLFNFAKHIINFRRNHPIFRNKDHFSNTDYMNTGFSDISFHGTKSWQADWSSSSRVFSFMLDGGHAKNGNSCDDIIYVALNMYWESIFIEIPRLPEGKYWHVSVNTDMPSPFDFHSLSDESRIEDQLHFIAGPRSVIILIGK
jgi:glycogen operon protein